LAPISSRSDFKEKGEISPENFVAAGDYLCTRFPTWSWASGSPGRRRDHLPPNKQYIVTRHVPVNPSARDVVEMNVDENGWVETRRKDQDDSNLQSEPMDTDIPDIGDAMIEDEDEQTLTTSQPSRTYTLYITYSPYYRTPRMYLQGYDPSGAPLDPTQIFNDVSSDYAEKTVTIEEFPWLDGSVMMASVHPCMHASVMKGLVERSESRQSRQLQKQEVDEWATIEREESVGIRVDQYLVIFLKFMASVMPGVEYDFTMSM